MSNDDFYITTAIPYVNAPAHIGHALEFIQTDVLARYHRQRGKNVLLLQGADEHGTKMYEKAQELGKKPEELVNEVTESFKGSHKSFDISYDRFIRTSSDLHKRGAQAIWLKLEENGHIYKDAYSGWYCVGCEKYVTAAEADTNEGICPDHNRPYMQLEEENYFFRLSSFADDIEQAISSDEFQVWPETRKHEILSVIESGLDDISISRPASKLPWGVPVPGDETHMMYVWFEALCNYITALSYPDGEDFARFWPADVQVIGKDILRFHAAIWPGILLGIEEELPRTLLVHGFITSDGKKMSKTLGNVVDPFEVVDLYGSDALRYYLLRHVPSGEDGDFTWGKFDQAYHGELANDLGNLVQRTASMIMKYQNGAYGKLPESAHDVARYHKALDNYKFDRALDHVWNMIQATNKYIEQEKPWKLSKEDPDHVPEVLQYVVANILEINKLLKPFLPKTTEKIEKTFAEGLVNTEIGILFPPIENPILNASVQIEE